MGKISIPHHAIILAWATPFNLAQLCARLEAYAGMKGVMTNFRIAARHSALAAFHNLPEEILVMIANEVREILFNRKLKYWTRVKECLSNHCRLAHARNVSKRYKGSSFLSDDEVYEKFNFEAATEHREYVEGYCQTLSNLDGRSSKFARCVKVCIYRNSCIQFFLNCSGQVFTRDFGIRPYFLLHEAFNYDLYSEVRENDNINIEYVRAQAFLILPLPLGSISSRPSPHLTCFSIYEKLDPSRLQRFCQSPHQRFKLAIKMLNIQPNTGGDQRLDEDETYENQETWNEYSSCILDLWFKFMDYDESSDSEASEDDADDNYDDNDTHHKNDQATSPETPSNARLPPATANGSPETNCNLSLENRPTNKEETSPDPDTNGPDVWPKLMILGCGQFEGWDRNDWYRY